MDEIRRYRCQTLPIEGRLTVWSHSSSPTRHRARPIQRRCSTGESRSRITSRTRRLPSTLRRPGQRHLTGWPRLVRSDNRRARRDSYADPVPEGWGFARDVGEGAQVSGRRRCDAAPTARGFYHGFTRRTGSTIGERLHRKVDVLDSPRLGMDAVWQIEVENFPAFAAVADDKAGDFGCR